MTSHSAVGQTLGYLYQVRYALNLLLESDDPDYQISIEKFDDITFYENDTPVQLIQLKHHATPASLTDSSTDLWRTLNVWLDAIRDNNNLLDNTDFVIITTAVAPDNSVAELIQQGKCQEAFEKLKDVVDNSESHTNLPFYAKFISTDDSIILRLIKKMCIISSASNIRDIEKDIQKQIRYSCKREHIPLVTERIEGWWFQECIKALSSTSPVITTHRQIHAKINEIARQYDDDNLPIEFWDLDEVEEEELDPKDRIFLEQLRLLQCHSKKLRLALQDYYKASMQRSSWLRQGLVYANDLDSYEHRLMNAWKHAYADMEEDLEDYGSPSEEEKIRAGKALYSRMLEKDIRIRYKVDAPYVMQGTYHHLANSLRVGWHVDFFDRLKHLLKGVSQL